MPGSPGEPPHPDMNKATSAIAGFIDTLRFNDSMLRVSCQDPEITYTNLGYTYLATRQGDCSPTLF